MKTGSTGGCCDLMALEYRRFSMPAKTDDHVELCNRNAILRICAGLKLTLFLDSSFKSFPVLIPASK